ncbi:MAG: hypothetical protein K0S66_1175 [Sphingomonas sp.]|nr:hypothetical protein [Sphingomonas sp.]
MLSCGGEWQPTVITRVIEPILSSTCVVRVVTDAGAAFIKGMGNPQGNESLALELVGTELAALIGLTIPPFAIVQVLDLSIDMINGHPMHRGPAFASKALVGAPSDPGGTFLQRLANPQDVALLVAFDTWVRNVDRCPPPDYLDPTPKWDNLFFTPSKRRFEMVVFDHTHCFVEEDLEAGLAGPGFVEDERIYGAFPEFIPMLNERALRRACLQITRVDAGAIMAIIGSVPLAWGPGTGTRARWAELLIERGKRVEEYLFARLVPQLQMSV